ncbi:uncharacterized protein CANTADRAFT_87812 [Suhomyces tanzawaensis NRRL Y-17324]|uniref:Uncharacterized protein n=1 Tax=Suhomyces tanzawaensis NRRL Y-17324 TaxID=984487 RepID=A0A1E4SQY7_9ASCO|nr:uncharacterized protein CANTADRAFT_87812 [Suhomyces tanzawaensis NRRL Y-17324]ODV81857.1 hypothetical protein CANTADRAFT_87812 [Suhomyces tanzawaensis NRRL Y-17324]
MEHSVERTKRSMDLPSPQTLARLLEAPYKRQKIDAVPRSLDETPAANQHHHPPGPLEPPPPPNRVWGLPQAWGAPMPPFYHNAPAVHSVPPTMVPLIQPNAKRSDFYADLNPDVADPQIIHQVDGILQQFPPPFPPFLPAYGDPLDRADTNDADDNEKGGIMVPFIYPRPPRIDADKLPYSLASFKKKSVTPPRRTRRKGKETEPTEEDPSVYLQIPPLPFPPPNYMPYPVLAHKSNLTPGAVFDAFIDAHEYLPRTDMVVASAAGSLFDIMAQSNQEGFEIEEYEKQQRQKALLKKEEAQKSALEASTNSAEEKEVDSDEERENEFNEYCEYLDGISTEDYVDYHDAKNDEEKINMVQVSARPQEFIRVQSTTSDLRHLLRTTELDNILQVSTSDIINNPSKDITFANGNNRERRRKELVKTNQELEAYTEEHREQVYHAKRNQLLQRLKNLQLSKISFTDSIINDEELLRYKERIDTLRDEELVRLRMVENYDLLKNSLSFYQDSNRVYKHLNLVMTNKLEKLKHFLEFQKNIFNEYLAGNYKELNDIKSKESSKLFSGLSDRDYSQEIKEIIRKSMSEELKPEDIEKFENISIKSKDLFKLSPAVQHSNVHDFMPLITPEEFSIITGELPNKTTKDTKNSGGKQSNLKHQIFQSPLYDRITSGSDTNVSDSNSGSNTATAKRRGRRSNAQTASSQINGIIEKIKGDGPDSKFSEATLLAKIMKQFSGPQSAKLEELTNDLEMMGLKTMWPVTK